LFFWFLRLVQPVFQHFRVSVFLAFEKWVKLRFNTIRIADNPDLWKTVKNTGTLDLETKISCCFGCSV